MPVLSPPQLNLRRVYGPGKRSPWLDVDWRMHQHWTIINGSPVNVVELGEGPPLLFVHGLAGSWPNWLEQLPVFAGASPGFGGYRAIALDLPGFGHSPLPPWHISIAAYADALDVLLEELDVRSAAVVGNSLGGLIAAELAIRHPRRVERLALVCPAGVSTFNAPRVVGHLRRLRHVGGLVDVCARSIASHADVLAGRAKLRAAFFDPLVRHPSLLPAPVVAEQLRGAGRPGLVAALQAICDHDLRPELERIRCPALVVWGDRDRVISRRDLQVFGELMPDVRTVLYEDTGHMAQLERPAEFNALLAEFLEA
jgi:pimeloyl-ACP methyl ester carboxylesterase